MKITKLYLQSFDSCNTLKWCIYSISLQTKEATNLKFGAHLPHSEKDRILNCIKLCIGRWHNQTNFHGRKSAHFDKSLLKFAPDGSVNKCALPPIQHQAIISTNAVQKLFVTLIIIVKNISIGFAIYKCLG